MKYIFLSTTALALFCAGAQDFDKAKMDSLFSIIETHERGMGSIAIHRDGEPVYARAIGYAGVEDKIKADIETRYRIGSISKTYTATLVMKLVEQGKLTLDETLSRYYPEVKYAERITIEHLLRHRSGIFNFTNAEDYVEWMEDPISKSELVAKIVSYGSIFEPGEKAEYSNSNYVLLTFIIEEVTGRDYSEVLRDMILESCQLTETYFGSEIDLENNEAQSYYKIDGWERATETDMSVPVGAGSLVSTPTDLNQFYHCLFEGRIVSQEFLDSMTTTREGFGIGLFGIPFYEEKGYGHTGGIDGFQSMTVYFPGRKLAVSYTTNSVIMSVNDIILGALSIYLGLEYELPEFTEGLVLSTAELDAYPGVYSSENFPLKITITREDNTLRAEATGQPSFPLEAYETHKFRFEQAGLTMEFIPEENAMIFRQGGGEFTLNRE